MERRRPAAGRALAKVSVRIASAGERIGIAQFGVAFEAVIDYFNGLKFGLVISPQRMEMAGDVIFCMIREFAMKSLCYFGMCFFVCVLPAGSSAVLGADTASAGGGEWMPEILSPAVGDNVYVPDFSYAGYHWGEEAIAPQMGRVLEATDFGAVADDEKDDTEALKKALAAANAVDGPVTLRLGAGRFILKDILYIERSHFVLQGAGSDPGSGTTIYIPQPLKALPTPVYSKEVEEYLRVNNKRQVEKDRGVNAPYSLYAWSGAFIWTNYPGERAKPYMAEYNPEPVVLATIKSGQRRGHVIEVEDAGKLQPGEVVRINWYNKEGEDSSLIKYLYNNQGLKVGVRHWEAPDEPLTKQEVTIARIDGNQVFIKEPLLHDLRPEWYPDITHWNHISEVGIENLRIEFVYQEYVNHHVEDGYNAVYLTNTTHSWIRNVRIRNADSGVLTDCCSNVTLENIQTYGRTCHYAVHYGDCYNMLARNLYIQTPAVHTFTFNTGSRCCVYTHCTSTRTPTLDQHGGLNYQNLFDDILLYEDDPEHNPITMGGASYWRPTHAAFPVFWNIRLQFLYPKPETLPIPIQGVTDGPSARLVGITANYPLAITYGPDAYMEGINRPNIAVQSLYDYQFKERLGRTIP